MRIEALTSFKNLMRARKRVFRGDSNMLFQSKRQIYEEYRKNKNVCDVNEISQLIEGAREAARFIEFGLAQAVNSNVQLTKEQVTKFMDSDIHIEAIPQPK